MRYTTGIMIMLAAAGFVFGAEPFYVATNGNDAWSGKLAAPNAESSDGPFATLQRARDAIRAVKAQGELGPAS